MNVMERQPYKVQPTPKNSLPEIIMEVEHHHLFGRHPKSGACHTMDDVGVFRKQPAPPFSPKSKHPAVWKSVDAQLLHQSCRDL